MTEDVLFSRSGTELTARLMCEIDHHTARKIRERIDAELFLARPGILIIDFSAVHFMDSSGIGLILGRVESACAVGAAVRISGLSPALLKLIRLAGVDKVKNLSITR